ncbi:MAG: phosphohistidine phosphatase SixA [Chloroflexi bacterium]|nr:phosphohistidine phosphatase SixA [Chloroflexota bacterium]
MDLYLVRHGVAYNADAKRWPDDRDRPLTPAGEKRFQRAARGLARVAPSVDRVLSSPLSRAWRTAELLASDAKWPKPVVCQPLEPGGTPAGVLLAVQGHGRALAVALVGHEPSMHELVSYLLTGDTRQLQVEFRKGGVARLEIGEGLRPGTARLVWLLAPKVLRGLGG